MHWDRTIRNRSLARRAPDKQALTERDIHLGFVYS